MQTKTRFYIDAFLQNLKSVAFFTYLPVLIAKLGATPFQISLSNSLPPLFSALSLAFITRQLPLTYRVYFTSGILRQIAFLCMAVSPLLPHPVFWLLFFWAFNAALVMITSVQQPAIVRTVVDDHDVPLLYSRLKNIALLVTIAGSFAIGKFLDSFQHIFPFNYMISMAIGALSTFTGMSIIARLAPRENTPIRFHWTFPLRHPSRMLMAMMIASASIAVMNPVWTVYHVNHLHLGNLQIGMFGIVSGLLSTALMPWIRKGLEKFGARPVIVVATAVLAVVPMFYPLWRSYWYILGLQIVLGVAFACYDVAQQTLAVTESKTQTDVVEFMSDYQFVQNFGNGIAPILAGFIIVHLSMSAVFITLAGLKIGATFVVIRLLLAKPLRIIPLQITHGNRGNS